MKFFPKNKYYNLYDALFTIFLFFSFLSEHSVFGQYTLVLFILFSFIKIVQKNFSFSKYLFLECIFLIYCVIQNLCKIPEMPNVANSQLKTLFICFVFDVCFYNYLIYKNNISSIVQLIIHVFIVAIPWSVLISLKNFLSGIRSGSDIGISILGVSIGSINGVSIAWVSGICLVLMSVFLSTKKEKRFWIYLLVFGSSILFSGTRKAIMFILFAIFSHQVIKDSNNNLLRKTFKNIGIVFIFGSLSMWLIFNISFLYDLIGYRLNNIIQYLSTGIINDSSLNTRIRLTQLAVNAIHERPYTGWGLDNFRYVFYNGKFYTHNNYLEIAVSGGFFGCILYYLKYVYIIKKLIVKQKRITGSEKSVCFLALIGFILFSFLEIWQVTYYNRKMMIAYLIFVVYAEAKGMKDYDTE